MHKSYIYDLSDDSVSVLQLIDSSLLGFLVFPLRFPGAFVLFVRVCMMYDVWCMVYDG